MRNSLGTVASQIETYMAFPLPRSQNSAPRRLIWSKNQSALMQITILTENCVSGDLAPHFSTWDGGVRCSHPESQIGRLIHPLSPPPVCIYSGVYVYRNIYMYVCVYHFWVKIRALVRLNLQRWTGFDLLIFFGVKFCSFLFFKFLSRPSELAPFKD